MTIETFSNLGKGFEHVRKKSSAGSPEDSFLKKSPNFNNLKITIGHWQLRDLVQSSSKEPWKVYYTYKDQIRSYNYKTNKVSSCCKLDFQPRCFAENDGLILSGGVASNHGPNSTSSNNTPKQSLGSTCSTIQSKGLLNLYNTELDISNSVNVGSLINNHVSLYKSSNYKFSSLVSNNDYCLYACNINNRGDVGIESETNLGFAVNHASLSPDHKTIVACGDSKRIVLLHDNGSSSSSKLAAPSHKKVALKTSYDSGLSIDFSADGKQFCCAFQDGVALMYDIRNYKKPLHMVYSTRPKSAHGAFRCCKFSGGTDDLLVVSEHTGRTHLVDTRNFEKHEVVLLPKVVHDYGSRSSKGGVYNEPFVEEYKNVLANYNNIPDNVIRYNINSDYLYHCNGISSETDSLAIDKQSPSSDYLYDESRSSAYDTTDGWSEYDQESTSMDYHLGNDFFYNSNNQFHVSSQLSGYTQSRDLHSDEGRNRALYEESPLDINGVDWYYDSENGKSYVLVGCSEGLFRWEVDSWSRRCFPSYEIC